MSKLGKKLATQPNEFATDDKFLAAFLLSRSHPLVDHYQNEKHFLVFQFQKSPAIFTDFNEYVNNNATILVKDFINAFQTINAIIRTVREQDA